MISTHYVTDLIRNLFLSSERICEDQVVRDLYIATRNKARATGILTSMPFHFDLGEGPNRFRSTHIINIDGEVDEDGKLSLWVESVEQGF